MERREVSWPLWVVVIGSAIVLVAVASAAVTWLAVRNERPTAPNPGGALAASEPPERVARAGEAKLAGAPLTCAKVTSCCRQIALRSSGAPGNCDGFLQLADQACTQALEGFRTTARRLGTSCD
jgi:hypothetical protein